MYVIYIYQFLFYHITVSFKECIEWRTDSGLCLDLLEEINELLKAKDDQTELPQNLLKFPDGEIIENVLP